MSSATSSCRSASTADAGRPAVTGGATGGRVVARIRRLEVRDLRVWERLELRLPEGLSVIAGPNGAGKTSIVEAVVLGCVGVSPRTAREVEIVRAGAEAFHVKLTLAIGAVESEREIGYAPRRGRRLRIDGESVRSLADWRARVVLVFLPEELRSVKGPPAARRRALDRVLEAAVPGFAADLSDYQRALAQRNALLRRIRQGQADESGLEVWERTMADRGARVIAARQEGVAALAPGFGHWLATLGGGEGGSLTLESWWPAAEAEDDAPADAAAAAVAPVRDMDDLAGALRRAWAARRAREVAAGHTLGGPHRDDVAIGAAGRDLRRLGSQGEQRTAALALLLAARDHLADAGCAPVLLLDDVLSELDPGRRRALLQAVGGAGQTLVTTADPAVVHDLDPPPDALIHVAHGVLLA
jgi:DNA replication and repair protein RecF